VDARPLAPTPILLSDIDDVTIDSVIGAGTETAEWFNDSEMGCGLGRAFFATPNDKSFWFVFSAETSGSLELLITPENLGTSYDFAIWRGGCPNDATCGQLFYCNFAGLEVCDGNFKPVGASTDPINQFGYDPLNDLNLFVYPESIPLEAGENYYLLVQNTDKASNSTCPTPLENDSLGFTIQFDGTATIGPEILHQDPTPILPTPVTDTLFLCEGDSRTFAVSQVQFATTYDWVSQSLSDATITPNALGDSVSVQFGRTSGKICMEMICPVQSLICWDIDIELDPNLSAIPNPIASCEPVDLNTRFQDSNNISDARVDFFTTQSDAVNDINPLASSIVSVSDTYWVRKTTPNGCWHIAAMNVLVDLIDFSVEDTLKFCAQTQAFANLRNELTFTNLNPAGGDLVYFFYQDSLEAVSRTNPTNAQAVFTDETFYIRAEKQGGGPCFDIKKLVFIIENSPEIAPIPDRDICGGDAFQLMDLNLEDTNGQPLTGFDLSFYLSQAEAEAGDIANTLNTEVNISDTYWVRAASSLSCFAVAPFTVNFLEAPDVDDSIIDLDCTVGAVNLADQQLTEKNGITASSLSFDYYSTLAEAEDLMATPLADLNITTPTDVWVRVTNTDNNCTDVAQISIQGMTVATATISGDALICAEDPINLQVDFTGDAPFNFSYTDGVTIFDTISPTNNLSLILSTDTSITYTLVAVQDGNGCAGSVDGAAMITVNDRPMITNPSEDCNTTSTEYKLSFEIIGTDNYQVVGIDGTLTGNRFESVFIPSGAAFDFQVIGDNSCAPLIVPINLSCQCNSVVDAMDFLPINVCDREPAIGNYLGPGGENLDKEDMRYFVLHDSPTNVLGNIVGFEEEAIFTFDQSTMTHGITYYMSAVITKPDMLGNPILSAANNPCIAVSIGTPVTFFAVPEVSLSLSNSTVCKGDMSFLTFNITGVGPEYDVTFFDGETSQTLLGITDGETIPIPTNTSTSLFVQSINQSGVLTCVDMPLRIDHEIELTVIDVPAIINSEIFCNDEGSMLVLTFELEGGLVDSYTLSNSSTITGSFKGTVFTSDSIPHNTNYSVSFQDANQCGEANAVGIAECLCTSDITIAIETLKGVSCRGEKDAVLLATQTNGAAPISFFWSTGATSDRVNNIAAGVTAVSMTDGNGCLRVDSIDLIEPRSLTASPNVAQPSCYSEKDGAIGIVQPEGGTAPYSFSFNGSPFGDNDFREDLAPGVYTLTLRDDNGCEWTEDATLVDPPQLAVSLPMNTDVNLGESLDLIPQVNQDVIAITWESLDTSICADCSSLLITPTKSTNYKVTVMNESGCIASDQVLVRVSNDNLVYVPTVFSPNGDGANDLLRPLSSAAVQEINMFRVFNRWGELIYENKEIDMVSNIEGWDGNTLSGRKAPPGVYLYFAEVSFKNGTTEMLSGDVSLVR